MEPLRSFQEQWHDAGYLMKGVYREEASLSRCEREGYRKFSESLIVAPRFGGTIEGQRVRVSRALDSAARQQAGFVDRWALGERDRGQLYVDYGQLAEFDRVLSTIKDV